MKIISRSDWGAAKPESVTRWDVRSLKGVVVHWFGIPRAAKEHDDCPALLRSVQRSHQAGEFNDIAYNHGVCPHGTIYELRGFRTQTGANGTTAANRTYAAVVYMAGTGDTLTDAGERGLAALITEWRNQGAGRTVIPHGKITGSTCPGPDVKEWISHRGYDKVLPEDTFFTWARWYLGRSEFKGHAREPGLRPDVPRRIPAAWWKRLKVHLP